MDNIISCTLFRVTHDEEKIKSLEKKSMLIFIWWFAH